MDSVAATRNCSMKALPSIAFSEFTGSAGDVTARSIGGRTVLNHKAYQNKVKTPSQASSRNTLSKVSRAYKQLTDSQMKAWGALAEHMKGISTFGKAAEMTAHNAFVRINANREMAGEGMLVDAPEYKSDIPEVDWDEIWVTPKRVLLTGIVNPTGTYKLVVRMSAGQGVGISKGWNKTVIITPGMADDWGDAGLTQLYTEKIGFMPEVGEKVFIELYWLDPATGFVGETMRTTRFCITEEEAHEEGFEERVQVTEDMLVNEQKNVLTLNLEMPGGTGQIVTEGSFDIHGYGSYFYEYLKEEPEEIFVGDTMVFSRASARPDFKPGIMTVQYSREWKEGKYVQCISVSHRAGGYDRNCEIFGSNPIMGN